MNKLWAIPVLTLIMVAGMFYGGQTLLPDQVSAANDNNEITLEKVGYSNNKGSSGDINIFAFLFYFQYIGISSNNVVIAEYNNYISESSAELNVFNYDNFNNEGDIIIGNGSNSENIGTGDNSNNIGNSSEDENITESEAKSIAENELIGEDDLTIGSASLIDDTWVVEVIDENNTAVGTITIDIKTGNAIKDINPVEDIEDFDEDMENYFY
ncbi:hypothetical protein [Methanobrevibacter sp. DSM 116169]|uniref:hypothetical protein n=1 Tax=Methanobrevibacter sp. DSM 116169 TaxID=3242727 RepID=UPI0038FC559D